MKPEYRVVKCDFCGKDIYSDIYKIDDKIVEEKYVCPYCHTKYENNYGMVTLILGSEEDRKEK